MRRARLTDPGKQNESPWWQEKDPQETESEQETIPTAATVPVSHRARRPVVLRAAVLAATSVVAFGAVSTLMRNERRAAPAPMVSAPPATAASLPNRDALIQVGKQLHQEGVDAHHAEQDAVARVKLEEAIRLFRTANEPVPLANALSDLATAELLQGGIESARAHVEESLALRQQSGDPIQLAIGLTDSADLHALTGGYGVARSETEQALAIYREKNDAGGTEACLRQLGSIAFEQKKYADARAFLNEAVALQTQTKRVVEKAVSEGTLGDVALAEGRVDEAEKRFQSGYAVWKERKHARWQASFLTRLARVAAFRKDDTKAADLARQSLALYAMSHNALARTRPLTVLGGIALRSGDLGQAESLHREALSDRRRMGYASGIAESLDALAEVAVARHDTQSAIDALRAEAAQTRARMDIAPTP